MSAYVSAVVVVGSEESNVVMSNLQPPKSPPKVDSERALENSVC